MIYWVLVLRSRSVCREEKRVGMYVPWLVFRHPAHDKRGPMRTSDLLRLADRLRGSRRFSTRFCHPVHRPLRRYSQ